MRCARPGDQQIEAVTVSAADELVAVGWTDANGEIDAAVWTSSDGRDWVRVAGTGTALTTDGDQRMSSVASAGTTFIAAGTSEGRGSRHRHRHLALDGRHPLGALAGRLLRW